jgi:hypothetical protein
MELDSPAGWGSSAPVAGQGLRPLDWPGLCARLAAAQHLRRALAGVPHDNRRGSFAPLVPGSSAAVGQPQPNERA